MATTWYCLCLDVNGPEVVRFWERALGVTRQPGRREDDPGALMGPEGLLMELEPVPEPKGAKHRVHLDVHAASIDELTALGATVVLPAEESGFRWTLMADPEGGEFCAFLRAEPPAYRLYEVVVDSRDPQTMATWWGERLGVEPSHQGSEPWWWLEDIPGSQFESLIFNPVPEPKSTKNRIHWDVRGDVAELEAAGASIVAVQPQWTVMADPEGNEFCVFPPEQ